MKSASPAAPEISRASSTGRGSNFEGPRQREYPMPPLRDTDFTDLMTKAAKIAGMESVPRTRGDQFAGLSRAPGLRLSRLLRSRRLPRERQELDRRHHHPRGAEVQELLRSSITRRSRASQADNNGKVTGVLYIRDGKEYFQPAKVVLVASYTYENARLLLLSKSKAYPNGLSNNHGQVGKHHFGHWNSALTALFPFDINIWYGAIAQGVVIDEWADDNFDHTGLGFIGGIEPARVSREASHRGRGHGHIRPRAAVGFEVEGVHSRKRRPHGSGVSPDQQLSLRRPVTWIWTREVKDPLGDPVIRITTGPRGKRNARSGLRCKTRRRNGSARRAPSRSTGGAGIRQRALHPRHRRNAHGRQSRNECRRPVGLLA